MAENGAIKVLVVDDSDLVAQVIGEAFEAAGMTVARGRNGAEGVELAYRESPDVIVMDAEMPIMQGYLASRLLKNQRGVRDIPIVMHTSLAEDRDKYWAMTSGADDFVEKDFDRIDFLVERVRALSAGASIDRQTIAEDATRVSRDRIFEMLGLVIDQQLFNSTVHNGLAKIGRSMTSLSDTARDIMALLPKVCEVHLAVLLLKYDRKAFAFVLPSRELSEEGIREFVGISLDDFRVHFRDIDLGPASETRFEPLDAGGSGSAARAISSYSMFELYGRGDAMIGSLHLGNCGNDYFSERITSNVELFAHNAEMVLDNSIAYNQAAEMQKKVRSAFSKYVPREVIDELVEDHQSGKRTVGEKRVVTVLFSDIRNFTTISENNSAEGVVEFLNRYFNVMVGIVKKHGGTIDKFIGDALLAVFGAPTSYTDNTPRAVRAAREMIAARASVPVSDLVMPSGGLSFGIGIHEGETIVGNIGSREKAEYTVIGDTVNLASRLEGLTKYYQESVLVSETVASRLGDAADLREIDTVRVKGKETETRLFAIMPADLASDRAFLDSYGKGLAMYRMGNWATAIGYFRKALELQPDDNCSRILLDRSEEFQRNAPEDWDGSLAIDFK